MSMYRCAVCGSPNVQRVEAGADFSYKKALVGTAVFGAVGAVAGINGKKNYVYSCPDCHQQASLPMDDMTKITIDTCLLTPALLTMHHGNLLQRYSYLAREMQSASAAPANEEILNRPPAFLQTPIPQNT